MIKVSCANIVGQIWQLPWRSRLLLLETILCLVAGRICVLVLSFSHVVNLAAYPIRGSTPGQLARAITVQRVRWAVTTCARRVPWRALCFEQGLAAQIMLRRRGIPAVLYFGAAPDEQLGLCAHVWVREGNTDVIGGENSSRYAVLAKFPSHNKISSIRAPERR